MQGEWDQSKSDINKAQHGLAFADFEGFDGEPVVVVDDRTNYGEQRFRAFGRIEGKGYCVVYTMRGKVMRLISFRRARDKEMRRHGR